MQFAMNIYFFFEPGEDVLEADKISESVDGQVHAPFAELLWFISQQPCRHQIEDESVSWSMIGWPPWSRCLDEVMCHHQLGGVVALWA